MYVWRWIIRLVYFLLSRHLFLVIWVFLVGRVDSFFMIMSSDFALDYSVPPL